MPSRSPAPGTWARHRASTPLTAGRPTRSSPTTLNPPPRWAANEEFPYALVALGGDGQTHKGDGSHLADYYAYGRDVLAVADGVVVETGADATEANDRLQQPGESEEDFGKRTVAEQNKLLAKSYKAPLGNYVVIRHAGGEFSHYGHLK